MANVLYTDTAVLGGVVLLIFVVLLAQTWTFPYAQTWTLKRAMFEAASRLSRPAVDEARVVGNFDDVAIALDRALDRAAESGPLFETLDRDYARVAPQNNNLLYFNVLIVLALAGGLLGVTQPFSRWVRLFPRSPGAGASAVVRPSAPTLPLLQL